MQLPSLLRPFASAWIRGVTRRPWWTLAAVVLLTLAAAAGLPRLELRMDGRAMVPPDDPTVVFDREVREEFGWRDPLVVLLDSGEPGGIYREEPLRRLLEITERAATLEGVAPEDVTSLATERRDRVYPGTLKFRPFLDPFPEDSRLMSLLREDIDAVGILKGTLISADGSAAAVLVGVPDVEEVGDRSPFYRELSALVEPYETPELNVTVVGAPAAEALLGHHIMEDMSILMPALMLTMAVLLFLRLRRVWGVVLGLAETGLCVVATFGLMGWLGAPLSLTTGILPVVLISIGLADEIHVFSYYQLLLERDDDRPVPEVLRETFREMVPPVLFTSVTTSLGFLSFLASPIEPIRQFGLFAALGILYCLGFTFTVIPAALTLLPAARLRRPRGRGDRTDPILGGVRWLVRRPVATGLVLVVAVLVAASGVARLEVQDSWIEGFAPDSPFRRDTDRVNQQLLGTHNLLVHLQVEGHEGAVPPSGDGREGWLLDPALLEEIGRFENHLRSVEGVGGVLGPHSHLSTVAYLWLGRKEGTRRIPEEPLQVARVYRFFDIVRGKERRREVVHDDLDRALVNVFLKDANYQETKRVVEEAMAWEDRFRTHGVELSVAGDVAVSQAMIPAIVRSQVSSLLLAVLGAGLALSLLVRSLRTAVLTLLPVAGAVACVFGLMGWLGIHLGVATSMFCAITLGVGVDYAIHFVAAHRRAQAASAQDPAAVALDEAGPPILTDVAVIGLSFAWLAISQVPSNVRLGLLVALALVGACVLTLLGLGSFWSWRQRRTAVTGLEPRPATSGIG